MDTDRRDEPTDVPRPQPRHDSGVWETRKKGFLDRVLDFLYRDVDAP